MAEIAIRQYEPSDLERCRMLWEELTQAHKEIYDDLSIGGDKPGLYFDKHLSRVGPERIWVADRDGEVIGMVGLIVEEQKTEVEPVVVTSGERGKGIGKLLLDHVIEQAKKIGVRFLSIKPVARNTRAISLFHSLGFRMLGHIDMLMELQPPTEIKWKAGPELFGRSFKY
ncbi:MAG: GNAT family N-acetyltransferase [Thermoplasmata archaeon]